MNYSKDEDPYIYALYPTGQSPTIDIVNAANDTKVVDAAAMTELAEMPGMYAYLFAPTVTALTHFVWQSKVGTSFRQGTRTIGGKIDDLALEATSQLIKAETDKVAAIPVDTVLATDSRLDDIAGIKAKTDQMVFTSGNLNAIAQVVVDKTGYALSGAEKDAINVAVQAGFIDETDGQTILESILNKINADFDMSATVLNELSDAVRAKLPEIVNLDVAVSSVGGGGLDQAGVIAALNSQGMNVTWVAAAASNDMSAADHAEIKEAIFEGQIN